MDYVYDKACGERISRLRRERQLTQDGLAAKLQLNGHNITRSTISKIEAGQRHLYAYEAMAIAETLAADISDLLKKSV